MTINIDYKNKSIQQIEDEVLNYWKEKKIFEKSVEQRSKDNLYVFYDGPPFISGLPHYGHLLGSIAKDVIPRYHTMQGKRVERVWGWDAHGITVENKVQKELGIKNRKQIEEYGLEKFTQACYEYTSRISKEWGWYIDKIGRWVDIDNAYKTIDQSYMESVMWAFKNLYDKGLIFKGVRTSLYCPTCGTPVSNFEISMDNSYKEVEDPAVTIKFKVTSQGEFKDSYILAWTTTPWTLPSNRALVIDKDSNYVQVKISESDEKIILAEPRLKEVLKDKEYSVINTFSGSKLLGLSYKPLYDFYNHNENDFKVYSYENMVNMESGVGIVHCAPGFGDIDTEMGQHYSLSFTMAIDDEGNVKPSDEDKQQNPFKKMYYKKSNKFIIQDLIDRNLMFENSTIKHRYPYHDRCNTLIIHRAQESWFMNIKDIKPQLLEQNENINWVPNHIKHGQFTSVINNSPDWCISRSRFWATPMPVWISEDGDIKVIGSIKELQELSGKEVKDLHRPYIDEITFKINGKEYKRIPDVLDSWFESGSMPYAQMHYPFENQNKFDQNFPGDYIVEYVGQVRAWFNVLHRLSVGLFGKNSFKNVICTGTLAGEDGRKMSKTYQNYPDSREVLENIGGDALRLYLMSSPLMNGEDANFDNQELKVKLKNVLNPLFNSFKFFTMYADEYNFEYDKNSTSEHILDKWILARLKETSNLYSENIEKYNLPDAIKPIEEFVDDLSRWYVRRSRDRVSSGDKKALNTLYFVLMQFSKISASIIPFMSESIYLGLTKYDSNENNESVHLCNYPNLPKICTEETEITKQMSLTRQIVSLALALRVDNSLKVRQPLANLSVYSNKNIILNFYQDLIADEVNVKNVDTITEKINDANYVTTENLDLVVYLNTFITDELKQEGLLRDFIRQVQALRKKQGLTVSQRISVTYPDDKDYIDLISNYEDVVKSKVMAVAFIKGTEISIKPE